MIQQQTLLRKEQQKKAKTILPLLQAGGDDFMHLVKSLDTSFKNGVDQEAWDALEKNEYFLDKQMQNHLNVVPLLLGDH